MEETFGSKSRIPTPRFIATPRSAPKTNSADRSDFQLFNLEVKITAIAVKGAIKPCAISARIAQLKKSLEPVLA